MRSVALAAFIVCVGVAGICESADAAGVPVAARSAAVAVRVDRMRHGSADRIVLWLRRGSVLAARQQGDELILNLPAAAQLAQIGAAASQWVRGVASEPGMARVTLAPGARPRVWQWSDRVVIDVDDTDQVLQRGQMRPPILPKLPPPPSPPAAGLRQAGQVAAVQPGLAQAGAIRATALAALTVPNATVSGPPRTSPAVDPNGGANPGMSRVPPAASAVLLPADPAAGGPAILLPTDRQTGAAAFVRAGELHVVFDAARLLDLSQLKDDPVFGGATERLLPDGMELRMRLPSAAAPRLTRREDGWVLILAASGSASVAAEQIAGTAKGGVLTLAAAAPGRVVVVEDEATGTRLLVGTQRSAGQRVAGGHRAAEWALLPSWQGVVVQPLSDRVMLHDVDAGFELKAADPPALGLLWPEGADVFGADGRAMTRRFDLPGLAIPVLRRRLAEALRDAALAPRTARTAPRLRVAEAMLACGLDAEAAAVLRVASADDPQARSDPSAGGLAAMASWLSARAGGSAYAGPGFDAAALGDSDEAALWRALWSEPGADPSAAAGAIAPRWRLLLDYPELLRRRMVPAVAEALARGGQDKALGAMLTAFPDGSLDLARAGLLQRQGKTVESLAVLDRLGAGADRYDRAQALEAAVEQRVATHQLAPAAAADELDRQFYAWRGDGREVRLRLRAAELRTQGGGWRQALALLRETDTLFPDAHGRIHDAEVAVVSGVLRSDQAAKLGALDLMALADEASMLLGAADEEAALAPLLADRLLALDLPDRAEPIIRRLLDRAGDGAAKAGLGLRLAALVSDRGDAAGALRVLEASGGVGLDAGAAENRALLHARLLAATGRTPDALGELAGLRTKDAAELQATLLEGGRDWPGAARALRMVMDGQDFASMPAQAKEDLVLRVARDTSEAGDMAGLRSLRATQAALFSRGPSSGLFGVLTADPVQRVDDLPRSGQEISSMRALGQQLAPGSAAP